MGTMPDTPAFPPINILLLPIEPGVLLAGLPPAEAPMAMLFEQVESRQIPAKVLDPIATLLLVDVALNKALLPIAMLLAPVIN